MGGIKIEFVIFYYMGLDCTSFDLFFLELKNNERKKIVILKPKWYL